MFGSTSFQDRSKIVLSLRTLDYLPGSFRNSGSDYSDCQTRKFIFSYRHSNVLLVGVPAG